MSEPGLKAPVALLPEGCSRRVKRGWGGGSAGLCLWRGQAAITRTLLSERSESLSGEAPQAYAYGEDRLPLRGRF
jgi:hypothetical protein